MPGARPRLRIHKIGVYGDDWALLQGRSSGRPLNRHVQLSLRGEKPFGNRDYDYEQHVAQMKRLAALERHDPAQEARQTEDYHFLSFQPRTSESEAVEPCDAGVKTTHHRHKDPTPIDILREINEAEDYHFRRLRPQTQESKAVKSRTAVIEPTHHPQKAPKTLGIPWEASQAGDLYARKRRPHENPHRTFQPGKNLALRRLWGHDDAPSKVARERHRHALRRVTQLDHKPQKDHKKMNRTPTNVTKDRSRGEQLSRETPISTEGRAFVATDGVQGTKAPEMGWQVSDGHRTEAKSQQVATDPRVGFDSRTEMSSKSRQATTRHYELVASERKPLFTPRPFSAPDAPSLQVSHQAQPVDAVQYSGEFPVAAADLGPAESFQRSFAEDPVLMKAKLLAGMPPFSRHLPSRLDMHSEPRFRLVPSWRSTPGKMPKSPQHSEVISKSLETHMSELQIKDETKVQPEQPREGSAKVSVSNTIKPEATDPEQVKTTDNMESKVSQDRHEVDMQDAMASEDEGSGLDEPTEPPVPDNRSIFEKLFEKQEGTKGTQYGQLHSKLKIAEKAAKGREPSAVNRQDELETGPRDGLISRHGLSIFRQLFPEQAESETAKSEQESPPARHELPHPPEDSVMVSLRNEVRNWMSEEAQDQSSWPKPGDYGSHSTVVVISGTSPSLMDTDFYRIAPEGQHVEGWAGGLVKVIQAHDSISYEPLGQYYLMFYSRPSALAYVDEVWRLHELSRKMLHAPADSGREVAKGPLDQAPTSPQPFLTDAERAAVRSFTLCSPHITPSISVRMWNTNLVRELAAKSNIADVLPTLRPEGSTPARVLLRLTSPDGQHGEGQGGLTADELWLTLRDDGRERSAPWVLANLSEGIMPVKPRFISEHYKITVKAEPVPVPLELGEEEDDMGDADGAGPVAGPPPPHKDGDGKAQGVDRNERFRRFVLTFTQPAIARRFVRCWHKRVVYDALLDRSVVVDAVAIM